MVRLGKLTDYGLVLMTCMARSYVSPIHDSPVASLDGSPDPSLLDSRASLLNGASASSLGNSHSSTLSGSSRHSASALPAGGSPLRTARDLAAESKLPISTVSKLLKHLSQGGLLTSHRGIKGGYVLARDPREISVLEVIAAVEGQMALTECSTDESLCHIEPCCPIKSNQRIINQAVRGVLEKVMLSDLANPMQLTSIQDVHGRIVPAITSRIQ